MTRPVDPSAADADLSWPVRAAWAVLEHAPASADPLLHITRRWIRPLASLILPVETRRGRTRSGADSTLLVVGRGRLLEYLSRRFFRDEPASEPGPPVALHRLRDRLADAIDAADLVLALVPRVVAAHAAGAALLRVPAYVDFLLPTSEVAELKAARPSLRKHVRRVRRSPLVGRISHDPAAFEQFYFQFYLPSIADRHRDLAERQPLRVLRRRCRFGGILWVERDGVALSSNLYELRGDTMNLLVSGRRSSGDAALDTQVGLASYLFPIDLACERGCTSVHLGGTVPVLSDGVFRYKRAWGARVAPRVETHSELLVGWRSPGRAVLAFLAEAPLVYRAGGSLAAVAAVDSGEP
ncbi:MAG TPA: hypothetical protein VE592_02535, partial [Geminicoccaceae bacterium]|nr:hypothetical protein [Geminicoccaceae bacterium]